MLVMSNIHQKMNSRPAVNLASVEIRALLAVVELEEVEVREEVEDGLLKAGSMISNQRYNDP